MSVSDDCAVRKRIFSGSQGYIALKRKKGKQLHAKEIFLSFSAPRPRGKAAQSA
jgi:hypothetical protein